MATTGVAPVKQALVEALRANTALKAMVGSKGINEGVEPRSADGVTPYPYIVYSVIHSRREWDGTNMSLITDIDVYSISDNQVVAHTLDQLVADSLEDIVLDVGAAGQTSLLCRRIGDLSSADVDPTGTRIYSMCGVYRIWTDQKRTA